MYTIEKKNVPNYVGIIGGKVILQIGELDDDDARISCYMDAEQARDLANSLLEYAAKL